MCTTGCPAASRAANSSSPHTCAQTCRKDTAGTTCRPVTRPASWPFSVGTTKVSIPASRAAIAAASTEPTGRTRPSRSSSPTITQFATRCRSGSGDSATSTAIAIPRSSPDPRLGSEAGPSPTVIRPVGHCSALLATAARTRSRASEIAVSGKPTMAQCGSPEVTCAAISTKCARAPITTADFVRPTPISPLRGSG